jgi:hypothetical protein
MPLATGCRACFPVCFSPFSLGPPKKPFLTAKPPVIKGFHRSNGINQEMKVLAQPFGRVKNRMKGFFHPFRLCLKLFLGG